MNENPFEQSTLHSQPTPQTSSVNLSTPVAGSDGVEVRYPAAQRTLVPAAILLTGFIAPIVVFFVLQPPLNYSIAVALAIMEFSTAGFLWFLFNSSYVRADATGITKSQMGQTRTVRWEEIGGVVITETSHTRPPRNEYILKDSDGRTLLQFSDLGNREDGEKLRDYIADKREQQ